MTNAVYKEAFPGRKAHAKCVKEGGFEWVVVQPVFGQLFVEVELDITNL